jgi:nicotinamide-nucleotide amidase
MMHVELITIGAEILLGQAVNSNAAWLGSELSALGWPVARQTTVPDTAPAVEKSLEEALERADLVITTGGLGPTSDDLTKAAAARLFSISMREDPVLLDRIKTIFAERRSPFPPGAGVQALVPEGAEVLPNDWGTAPGLVLRSRPGQFQERSNMLILLPGPPRELRPIFACHVAPLLKRTFGTETAWSRRVFRTTGLGESFLEQAISDALPPLLEQGLDVGYCARPGEVDLRVMAQTSKAELLFGEFERVLRNRVGPYIYSDQNETLEEVVIQLLRHQRQSLVLAESCTGGYLAHRITNVPGASDVFLQGFVVYSNAAKQQLLGVSDNTLSRHGSVSEGAAREMAEGGRQRSGATCGVSITGIAGPGGGSVEKPVGTVFIGIALPSGTQVFQFCNAFDRLTFKEVTSQQALDLLRRGLKGLPWA